MSVSPGTDDTPRSEEDAMIDQLVVRASHDWLSAREFFEAAAQSAPGAASVVHAEVAVSLSVRMVREGLAVPGAIVASRHVPWPGTLDESLERVASHWRADPTGALIDGYVWFHPSATALERARALGSPEVDSVGLWSYAGHWAERPDGIKIGLRRASARGGAVIDVLRPDGTEEKVVVR